MLIRYRLTRPARDKPEVVYVVITEHKHVQIFELFSSVYTPHGMNICRNGRSVRSYELCEFRYSHSGAHLTRPPRILENCTKNAHQMSS